jgi:hypothetical protein
VSGITGVQGMLWRMELFCNDISIKWQKVEGSSCSVPRLQK